MGFQGIYINQFASSGIMWREQGVSLTQKAGFPASTTSTTTITIKATKATTFAIKLRVPAWAVGKNTVHVNGKAVAVTAPGTYVLAAA